MLAITVNNVVAIEHHLPATHHEERENDAHSEVHVEHCHVSRGSCGEQPIPSGPGQMLFAEPLQPSLDAFQIFALEESSAMLSAFDLGPATPPPRA